MQSVEAPGGNSGRCSCENDANYAAWNVLELTRGHQESMAHRERVESI